MTDQQYRFTGHETFTCRYAWLPKAVRSVADDSSILNSAREDDAMVELGVGKNMVRSIRFWAEAMNVIQPFDNGHKLTDFGRDVFGCLGQDEGHDPYLEDIQTLWLLHWNMSTNQNSLIFAWDLLMNRFHEPELHSTTVIRAFEKALPPEKTISHGSLEQLYDVFIHSYIPTRGRKGEVREDNLDCPLVELDLLRQTGLAASKNHSNHYEIKFAFRREEKIEISMALFAYCLWDFWSKQHPNEQTLPFHFIVNGYGSPGLVFQIPEVDIRNRLLNLESETNGYFVFEDSASIPRVVKNTKKDAPTLESIYLPENCHVT